MAEATTCILKHREGGYMYWPHGAKWERVTARQRATIFSAEKARSILQNSISSKERDYWSVVFAEEPTKAAAPVKNAPLSPPLPATLPPGAIKCPHLPAFPDLPDLTAICQQQQALYTRLAEYKDSLASALSTIDMEISDLMHYIEMANLNAANGYKVFAMLKERRIRRRRIKDDMVKFALLADATLEELISGALLASMQKIDNDRIYTPRQLPELFTEISGKQAESTPAITHRKD